MYFPGVYGLNAAVIKPPAVPLEAGVKQIVVIVVHIDFSHSIHGPFARITGDADVAGTIDDDFAVDPQEAMRGVGVFCVGWLHSRVDMVWFDFQTLLSGKRRRRREQGRQNDCAISHVWASSTHLIKTLPAAVCSCGCADQRALSARYA